MLFLFLSFLILSLYFEFTSYFMDKLVMVVLWSITSYSKYVKSKTLTIIPNSPSHFLHQTSQFCSFTQISYPFYVFSYYNQEKMARNYAQVYQTKKRHPTLYNLQIHWKAIGQKDRVPSVYQEFWMLLTFSNRFHLIYMAVFLCRERLHNFIFR